MGLAWHDYHGDVIRIDGGAGAGACCVAAASGWCGACEEWRVFDLTAVQSWLN